MDTSTPLNRLVLAANSIADDLGFVALAELAQVLIDHGDMTETRIIGGHMVMLHVQRWGLGQELYRETQDADLGIAPLAVRNGQIISSLLDSGYERAAGNRFVRTVDDIPLTLKSKDGEEVKPPRMDAAIDILTPAYRRRVRDNVKISDELTTTEVPGLALALQRPAIELELVMTRLNGMTLETRLVVPDEVSALVLKALAWRRRSAPKDAVDIWRMLEVTFAAGLQPEHFDGAWQGADSILADAFESLEDQAMRAIADAGSLNARATRERHTRIRALLQRLLGA